MPVKTNRNPAPDTRNPPSLVTTHSSFPSMSADVPDLHDLTRGARQLLAVGREGERISDAVSVEVELQFARLRVPDFDLAVGPLPPPATSLPSGLNAIA